MLRLAITGADGFLGWHVRVLVRALGWPEPVCLGPTELADPQRASELLSGVDRVLHLAGRNRGEPDEVAAGSLRATAQLAAALRAADIAPTTVVYANSVQAGNGTPYGDAKATSARLLADTGLPLDDVRLPNLYGEHGRPWYNSVVATFCRVLADGGQPEVHADRELDLVHVTDAAARLAGVPVGGSWDPRMPVLRVGVRELAERLAATAATYRNGELPLLRDRHEVRLFNTYRSHCFPVHYPLPLPRRGDARGDLVETVRTHGGGQTFCSTSYPAVARGEHFHLAKMERFVVLRGSAEISLRRVGHTEVLRFTVTGDEPVAVDMPTMWVHKLVNTGDHELVTLFWTNELFDPTRPDTWPEPVDAAVPAQAAVAV